MFFLGERLKKYNMPLMNRKVIGCLTEGNFNATCRPHSWSGCQNISSQLSQIMIFNLFFFHKAKKGTMKEIFLRPQVSIQMKAKKLLQNIFFLVFVNCAVQSLSV